ncbi:MAG TPA: hypothetical protein VF708_11855 [Pyrinomonadaceae bacterium]
MRSAEAARFRRARPSSGSADDLGTVVARERVREPYARNAPNVYFVT